MPIGYLGPISYVIFNVKFFESQTGDDYNDMRFIHGWLMLEIQFFFNWIMVSILFIALAYIFKFKPISKDEKVLAANDDIWDDKDRDDYLHYLKYEYFLLTYILC